MRYLRGGIGAGEGPIAIALRGGIGAGDGPIAKNRRGGIGAGDGPIATSVAALPTSTLFAVSTFRSDKLATTTKMANTKVRM